MTRKRDIVLKYLIYLSALITVGVLVWILMYVLFNGFKAVDLNFLISSKSSEGILPMIVSTIYIIFLSLIISVPIGIFAALYLTEYAKNGKFIKVIRFGIESLAGIPSIIYGLFGMIFFVTIMRLKYSILSGAFTLSIMVLPLIIRTTEEALKTVPNSFREGSFALGASKLRTIYKIILPSAIQGILSGVILSIGRIIGESAAVYFTAGMVPQIPKTIFNSARTLSVHMYVLANEGVSFDQAYATAAVLIVIVALINFFANKIALALNRKNN